MNLPVKFLRRFRGLKPALARYPVTSAFLIAATVLVSVSIAADAKLSGYCLSLLAGAVLCAALQMVYERFYDTPSQRARLMVIGAAVTLGFYFLIRNAEDMGLVMSARTAAAALAGAAAFVWAPSIRGKVSFNDSFMISFKAFFRSAFYSTVLFIGCFLIFTATDRLIVRLDEDIYAHTANIIFVLFAPIFFLSLIPAFPGERDAGTEREAGLLKAAEAAAYRSRFLEVLISNIIIPLAMVFTVILPVYILKNIRGEFWTDSLLEPMLVVYAAAVIVIYILASGMDNKPAGLFRRILPKALTPIVVFQIVSSVLSISVKGVTPGRYYVILFGVFAASAGVIMSVAPVRKNGTIAAMLIVFSAVSVIPPVDAFSVSGRYMTGMLEKTLTENGMLRDGKIVPKSQVPAEDKRKIVAAVESLSQTGRLARIRWMPEDFVVYTDFESTFGFDLYETTEPGSKWIYVFLSQNMPLDIAGYDYFVQTDFSGPGSGKEVCRVVKDGATYALFWEETGAGYSAALRDESGAELIRFDLNEIFEEFSGAGMEKSEITPEEATFVTENEKAKLAVIVNNANLNDGSDQKDIYMHLYVLIRINP